MSVLDNLINNTRNMANQITNDILHISGEKANLDSNIYYSSVGFTNPKLGFISKGLSNKNHHDLTSKLGVNQKLKNLNDHLKTYNIEYTEDVREAMMKINPSLSKHQWQFTTVPSPDSKIRYENVFHPNANLLVNINNYKLIYTEDIPVVDGYTYQIDSSLNLNLKNDYRRKKRNSS